MVQWLQTSCSGVLGSFPSNDVVVCFSNIKTKHYNLVQNVRVQDHQGGEYAGRQAWHSAVVESFYLYPQSGSTIRAQILTSTPLTQLLYHTSEFFPPKISTTWGPIYKYTSQCGIFLYHHSGLSHNSNYRKPRALFCPPWVTHLHTEPLHVHS